MDSGVMQNANLFFIRLPPVQYDLGGFRAADILASFCCQLASTPQGSRPPVKTETYGF